MKDDLKNSAMLNISTISKLIIVCLPGVLFLACGQDIVRGYVAICLGIIGGPEAKIPLKSALRTENDPNVIRDIKKGLAVIANSPTP